MAGIKYGYKYTSYKGIRTEKKEGVFLGYKSKKWIVRKKIKGIVKSLAQFDNEEDAFEFYKNYGG